MGLLSQKNIQEQLILIARKKNDVLNQMMAELQTEREYYQTIDQLLVEFKSLADKDKNSALLPKSENIITEINEEAYEEGRLGIDSLGGSMMIESKDKPAGHENPENKQDAGENQVNEKIEDAVSDKKESKNIEVKNETDGRVAGEKLDGDAECHKN